MMRRKSYFNENDCNKICHAFAHHTNSATTTMETVAAAAATTTVATTAINDSNDFNNNDNNIVSDSITTASILAHEWSDEMDTINLEILWQPQQNDTQISADVVFIHGLHGKQTLQRN